ncbi:MAG: hypothetical protein ACP6IS_04750 [Candidatus Asgardarchaeia archaeon]
MIEDRGIVTVLLPLHENISRNLDKLIDEADNSDKSHEIFTILENLVEIYEYLHEYNKLELERLYDELNKYKRTYRGLNFSKKQELLQERINALQQSIETTKKLIWKYKLYSVLLNLISSSLVIHAFEIQMKEISINELLSKMNELLSLSISNVQDQVGNIDGIKIAREILLEVFKWKISNMQDPPPSLIEKVVVFLKEYVIRSFELKEWKIWVAMPPFNSALIKYLVEHATYKIAISVIENYLENSEKTSFNKQYRDDLIKYLNELKFLFHESRAKYFKAIAEFVSLKNNANEKVMISLIETAINEFEKSIALISNLNSKSLNKRKNLIIRYKNSLLALILKSKIDKVKDELTNLGKVSRRKHVLLKNKLSKLLTELDAFKRELADNELKTLLNEEYHILSFALNAVKNKDWHGLKENILFTENFRTYTLTQRVWDLLNDAKDEINDVINAKSARKAITYINRAFKIIRFHKNLENKEKLLSLSFAILLSARYLLTYRNSEISENELEKIRFRILEFIYSRNATDLYLKINEKSLENIHRDLANLALGDGIKYAKRILVEHVNRVIEECRTYRHRLYNIMAENLKFEETYLNKVVSSHDMALSFIRDILKIINLRQKNYSEIKESKLIGASIRKLITLQDALIMFYTAEIDRMQGAKNDLLHEYYSYNKNWSKAYSYCDMSINNFRSAYALYRKAGNAFEKLDEQGTVKFCEKMSRLAYLLSQQNWENIKRISDGEMPIQKDRRLIDELYHPTLNIGD